MTRNRDASPFNFDRPETIHRVREVLQRVGFDERHVPSLLDVPDMASLNTGAVDRPRLLRRTRDGDPLCTMIRLFLVGVPVEVDKLRAAHSGLDPAEWAELGLIDVDGNVARRSVMLWPSQGLIIAHDAKFDDGSQRRDHVLGVTGATLTLSKTMLRPDSRWTLDLGTGSGYLALLTSRHSQRVLATDLNERAVAMTRFNAMLNDVANVETAAGDLFEPTGDIRFDLIVSNPPFVISPENAHLYRDSGLQGDQICERLIRQAPQHLAEGGYAQALCNWVRSAGKNPYERVVEWVTDSGCDAWICHTHTDAIDRYADFWLRLHGENDPDRLAGRFDEWMAYYEREGIEAIDAGVITLRRRTAGRNWIRLDTSRRLNHPNGLAIQVGFEARDLLDGLSSDRDLLELRLHARSEVRLSQSLKPTATGWTVEDAKCLLGDGLRFEGPMNQAVFHLLTLCRGQQTLAEVIQGVAARLGQSPDEVAAPCLEAVRGLIDQGFLWPNDETTRF
jgi:Methyltransferase small domain